MSEGGIPATCGCGKEGRYVILKSGTDGEDAWACNKYRRCPTYAELEIELQNANVKFLQCMQRKKELEDSVKHVMSHLM